MPSTPQDNDDARAATVPPEAAGRRFDAVLADLFPEFSRSRLAESFTRFVGQPPMQYLAHWRLQLAARMLSDGPAKVAAVARDVGYQSEASFSRAFKRFVGISPAQWRRDAASTARRT